MPTKNISTLSLPQENQLSVESGAAAMSVQQVLGQVALIQQILAAAMHKGTHFDAIPGCGDKPTLLKPGAEKLCLTFRLAPTYDVDERNLDRDHREYRVQCTLSSILTGAFLGQGVGTCSTMEGKYRFRTGAAEATDKPVPRAYWDLRQEDPAKAQELLGGKGFTVKKVDGKGWMIAKGGEKVETDNPADSYNTVLKMAKKRALVDAVLTATAASDIFSQDLEDISANLAFHRPALPSSPPSTQRASTAASGNTFGDLARLQNDDGIAADELERDVRANVRFASGSPVLRDGADLANLPLVSAQWIVKHWPEIKERILAARLNNPILPQTGR